MSYILTDYTDLFAKRHYSSQTKARVVPFYVVNNQIFFLLCEENIKPKHYQVGTYNIIGGHREPNETIFECAQRELKEETINILSFNPDWLSPYLTIKRNKRYIIFLPVDLYQAQTIIPEFKARQKILQSNDIYAIYKLFNNNPPPSLTHYLEIKNLKWISERDITNKNIYKSIHDIFKTMYIIHREIPFNTYLHLLKRIYRMSNIYPISNTKVQTHNTRTFNFTTTT